MNRLRLIAGTFVVAGLAMWAGCSSPKSDRDDKGGGKKSFDSPQEVFDAAAAAEKQKDHRAAVECLTEDSRDRLAAMLLTVGMLTKAFGSLDKSEQGKEKVKLLDDVFEKHGLTKEVLEKAKKAPPARQAEEFKQLIKDPTGFVADMLAVMPRLSGKKGDQGAGPLKGAARLEDLKIDGDTASGVAVTEKDGKKERTPIKFKKEAGGWKIELPAELLRPRKRTR
jgi:hypothetical protein